MNRHCTGLNRKLNAQTIVTRRHGATGCFVAWTDGSCYPNPGGPGGWGVRLIWPDHTESDFFGGESATTNNRMEMAGILAAVEACPLGATVIVRTDSQLCVLCAVGKWGRNVNLDLWARLDAAASSRTVAYEWWKGHAGTPGNEAADRLAELGRLSRTLPSHQGGLVRM